MTKDKRETAFGRAFEQVLDAHGLRQKQVAESIGTSTAYVSAVATGRKAMSPVRIDLIAEKLSLSEEESRRLHRAAALDAGFKLDLPDDF